MRSKIMTLWTIAVTDVWVSEIRVPLEKPLSMVGD